ncbi:MAG TPA: MBL fold metallo-hydrolase [Rhizomicrobium sp.]|nr:MBL fold metallo-hydrolase [Rhizomicrobium sp.]
MKISFHGAAQDVTGSCHLVEAAGKRILVDCGLFQGSRSLQDDNKVPFGFDARGIDHVLLTHAHLDHCGRMPLLVKRGYQGEIIATQATAELARLVLLDSAKLQEEDADTTNRRNQRAHRHEPKAEPLYTVIDATDCLARLRRYPAYGDTIDVCPGVRATFFNAGHILGSSSILLEIQENGQTRSILFSGDIGSGSHHILRPPEVPAHADMVVMETTYGDRLHRSFADSLTEFYDAVGAALGRGGNVVIPTFALERAQELLFFIRQGVEQNRLPPSVKVFLDSPMAISATQIFERHAGDFTPEVQALFQEGKDPFNLPGLTFARDKMDSIAINDVKGGAIIMAGSGMAAGGRILHHLAHNLPRPEASVIFVGYASVGTPARRIIDGAKKVTLYGEEVAVRATLHTINGFSAHADQAELLAWQARIAGKRLIALVHGEQATMQAFAAKLSGSAAGKVVMPKRNEEITLD